MLVSVYSYRVMVKSVSSCCVRGRRVLSNPVTYVVPIFKKGSRNDPSNYRPISLTCICCKLLEHIRSSAISAHANAGEHTDFILLDFSKAFDKVSHNSLLYGIS